MPYNAPMDSESTQVSGMQVLQAHAASGNSLVFIGRGLLAEENLRAVWPFDRDSSRSFCVSDERVWELYGERLGPVEATITIPPGEESKTLASAEHVWTSLARAGMTRADHVVALGGGVVGDLAGFCAATYQRGVPVIQIPTTLVSQTDSAYGGKTGIDLPEAKNYVGAYHQPTAVLVDPDVLATLSEREFAAGWAEVLRTALITGGSLWATASGDGKVDEDIICSCAQAKIALVEQDERDGGARQALNLGHTVAHAIETTTAYSRYLHGEAVALGLLAALRLSGQDELRAQVRELLLRHDLPVTFSGASVEAVIEATKRDKKRLSGDVPFVLLRAVGKPEIGCPVSDKELRVAVAEIVA